MAKRLVDIKKNSAIERKEEQKLEMDMKRMEQVCVSIEKLLTILVCHVFCLRFIQRILLLGDRSYSYIIR